MLLSKSLPLYHSQRVGISELQETLQLGGVPGLPGPLASNLREEGAQYQILGNAKRPPILRANLPFTFLLLGRASSGGDLLLAIRLGGIFLS